MYINLLNIIYPIGSVYMSTSDVSPSELIGGIWTKISDNTVLGAGNGYGGSHTITVDNMPSHGHKQNYMKSGNQAKGYGLVTGSNLPFQDSVCVFIDDINVQQFGITSKSLGGVPVILLTTMESISGCVPLNQGGGVNG